MKKIISLALVLVLAVGFAVPASASEFDNTSYTEILDYSFVNGSSNYVSLSSTTDFNVPLPSNMYYSYVEIIVRSGVGLSGISVAGTSLTRVSLENNMYRYYGNVGFRLSKELPLTLISSGTHAAVEFLSIKISRASYDHVPEVGTLYVNDYTGSHTVKMSSSGNSASYTVPWDYEGGDGTTGITTWISVPNWRKYDYLDISFDTSSQTITSISAMFGAVYVPCDLTYLNDAASSGIDAKGSYIVARLDLRGLDRTKTDSLFLRFDSTGRTGTATTTLYRVSGYIVTDTPSAFSIWMRRLQDTVSSSISSLQTSIVSSLSSFKSSMETWFTNIRDNLNTNFQSLKDHLTSLFDKDTTDSDEFAASIESQVGQIDDANNALDSVTKPDVDDINVSLDSYVDSEIVSSVGDLFGVFLSGGIFSTMVYISLTLALVSFVLYGKRS